MTKRRKNIYLKNGKVGSYLNKEICAVLNDWLIVYDGKYNYMLFNTTKSRVLEVYERNGLPSNHIDCKCVEYYSTFDNALDNLMRVVVQNGFNPEIRYKKVY